MGLSLIYNYKHGGAVMSELVCPDVRPIPSVSFKLSHSLDICGTSQLIWLKFGTCTLDTFNRDEELTEVIRFRSHRDLI